MPRRSDKGADLDRRLVLGAIASLAGLACAPRTLVPPPPPPLDVGDALAVVPPGVRVVGQRYLDAHPDEADVRRLQQQVDWPVQGDSAADWHARLDAAMVADLEADRIVEVGGWQLPQTECRVYALATLIEDRGR